MKTVVLLLMVLLTGCTLGPSGSNYITINIAGNVTIPTDLPPPSVPPSADLPTSIKNPLCALHAFVSMFPNYCPISTTTSRTLSKPVVGPLYSIAANWNTYVNTADTSIACAGTEIGYASCIHGGDKRQAVTQESSCAGLLMTDSLGVFDWTCQLVNSVAVFQSSIKLGKGLKDLISGTSWQAESVTLSDIAGDTPSQSDISDWWTNRIYALPNNASPSVGQQALTQSNSVYVTIINIQSSGYNIQSDGVSVVTLNGSLISKNTRSGQDTNLDGTPGNGYRTIVSSGGHKFLWIEADTDMVDPTLTGGAFTIFLSNTTHSVVNNLHSMHGIPVYFYQGGSNIATNVTVSLSYDFGFFLDSSSNNYVQNLVAFNNPNHYGLAIGNAQGNEVTGVSVYNSFGGIRLFTSTGENHISNVLISGVKSGIYLPSNYSRNIISQVTIADVDNNSGVFIDRSDNQIIHNVVVVNSNYGVTLSVAHDNEVSNVGLLNNSSYGINEYSGDGFKISGNLVLGSNTIANCNNQYGGNPGFGSNCSMAGRSDATIVSLTADASNSFIGEVTSDERNNSAPSGTALYSDLLDSHFANPFRQFGLEGSALVKGICLSGDTCRIRDFMLAAADTVLTNVNLVPPSAGLSPCPSEAYEELTTIDGRIYLKNAVELLDRSTGNKDGLCESGETCLLTANLGVYQGAEITSRGCYFNGSANLTGVIMFLGASN